MAETTGDLQQAMSHSLSPNLRASLLSMIRCPGDLCCCSLFLCLLEAQVLAFWRYLHRLPTYEVNESASGVLTADHLGLTAVDKEY